MKPLLILLAAVVLHADTIPRGHWESNGLGDMLFVREIAEPIDSPFMRANTPAEFSLYVKIDSLRGEIRTMQSEKLIYDVRNQASEQKAELWRGLFWGVFALSVFFFSVVEK